MDIHTVEVGESVTGVAQRYGISPIKLAAANGIHVGERLLPGEELLILVPTRTATAKRGERLSDIARRFRVSESSIIWQNPEAAGGKLYDGQPITVRGEPALFGLGIGNGYFYRGATEGQLVGALPYLNYVTVCSALAKGGGVSNIFNGERIAELARAAGKLPLLRVFVPSGEKLSHESVGAAIMMARGGNYHGITLPLRAVGERAGEVREEANRAGLKLALECDAEAVCTACDDADMTVLIYDKIEREPIPNFEDGEGYFMQRYADRHNATRAFIDISPFAYTDGKYLTKAEAREAVIRAGGEASYPTPGVILCEAGKGGHKRRYIWESLSGVRRRLVAVSENGYFGISFDIARAPIAELMMFRSMFSEGIGMA